MTIEEPLTGVRVVDLSIAHAGSYSLQLLSDLGAEVIKVENPGMGDVMRVVSPKLKGESYYILALNRNKRNIALDLYTVS